MAIETFKIINKLSPPVLNDLLQKHNTKYNFTYSNLLQIPSVKTTSFGKNSFMYAAPALWNSLPEEFRQANSFSQFKNLVTNWNGKDCHCSYCSPY